jgi:outer membrane protein assembly factor BamB
MYLKHVLTTIFALSIIASMAVTIFPAKAQQVYKQTYAVISVTPNPVGVGQYVYIVGGITDQTAWPQPGWKNLEAIIKRPDNRTDKLTFNTFTTGIGAVTYKPDKTGIYKISIHFPEQICEVTVRNIQAGTIMKESYSREIELVVQQDPVPSHPGFPLPQEYWTRPVDPQLREWASVKTNWLNIQTYTRIAPGNDYAPETPHVLWSQVLDDGGLIGELVAGSLADYMYGDDIAGMSYEHGDAYEGKWLNPVVINGILYYNLYPAQDAMTTSMLGGVTITQTVVAVDIHTGQELWRKTLGDNERLAFGQVMYWETQNMIGAFAYIWTTVGATYKAYDPLTGRWEFSIAGVPSGTRVAGPKGEILIYQASLTKGWIALWNSTKAVYQSFLDIWAGNPAQVYYANRWRPHGATINGTKGYMWNVTISQFSTAFAVKAVIPFDTMLISNTYWSGAAMQPNPVFAAISLKPDDLGTLKFNVSWPLPYPDTHVDIPGSLPIDPENRVFVVAVKEVRKYFGFNLDTGAKIWGPTTYEEPDFHSYSIVYMAPWGQSVCAYGKLFTGGYGGEINAYDVKTGQHLWTYKVIDSYNEFAWGNWPTPIYLVSDGKIYIAHQEHSGNPPLPRGAPFACLNATTGEEIFKVDGLLRSTRWGGQPIIADSTIISFDSYSNMIFAIGKGPTQTTVEAPNVGVSIDSTIVIRGTVIDISPGTRDIAIQLRFPNGVPAVSDEDMGDWMLYVYKQFSPRPTDVQGVWVKLDAINVYTGEYIDIGGTHTDSTGMFTVMWAPPKEGLWTILATFPGSKSYYPSFAETSIAVTGTPAAPAAPAFTTADLIIIAIVLIIGIAILFMVRKK